MKPLPSLNSVLLKEYSYLKDRICFREMFKGERLVGVDFIKIEEIEEKSDGWKKVIKAKIRDYRIANKYNHIGGWGKAKWINLANFIFLETNDENKEQWIFKHYILENGEFEKLLILNELEESEKNA